MESRCETGGAQPGKEEQPEQLEALRTGGILVDFYRIREIWGKNEAVFVRSPAWELRGAVLPRDRIAARDGCEAVGPLLRGWFYSRCSQCKAAVRCSLCEKSRCFAKKRLCQISFAHMKFVMQNKQSVRV